MMKVNPYKEEQTMATNTHEANQIDIRHVFQKLREEVEQTASREDLDELYKRTGYMITLTHAIPTQDNKYSDSLNTQRRLAEEEFTKTVRKINDQAKKLGAEANYNEKWDELNVNNNTAEENSLLESNVVEQEVDKHLDEAVKLQQGRGL
jgi:hypothetical protein